MELSTFVIHPNKLIRRSKMVTFFWSHYPTMKCRRRITRQTIFYPSKTVIGIHTPIQTGVVCINPKFDCRNKNLPTKKSPPKNNNFFGKKGSVNQKNSISKWQKNYYLLFIFLQLLRVFFNDAVLLHTRYFL